MTPSGILTTALAALPSGAPQRLGVAVSGGGDSMALLVLLADWARETGRALRAVTVDHGLRWEAAEEAEMVARLAQDLDVPHDTLLWSGWKGQGNLQAAARTARLDLIADWSRKHDLSHVAVAHTREDQAETVLLRLARGSGVDGLAAMAPHREDAARGVTWLRPLLQARREDLRSLLTDRGIGWAEDPSNTDDRFERVRARALLADPPLPGLGVDRLAETAARMAAARDVLAGLAENAARTLAGSGAGVLHLATPALWDLPDDTRWRILSAALCVVGAEAYRPRLAALTRAEDAARSGKTASLHGCLLVPARDRLWITREVAAVPEHPLMIGPWDGRWQINGPYDPEMIQRPLGETGLSSVPDWRDLGLPHAVAVALPGIWWGNDLLAAPAFPGHPGRQRGWTATPLCRLTEFSAVLKPD